MSLNITTIEDALLTWLGAITGENIALAEDNGIRPAVPFSTVKLLDMVKIGTTEVQNPDANGDRLVVNNYELSVSLQFFGPGALQTVSNVVETLGLETGTATLEAAGLYYFRNNGIQNLTELLRGDYERRAGLDIIFGTQATPIEAAGLIEHINLTGTVKDPSGAVAHTINISQ